MNLPILAKHAGQVFCIIIFAYTFVFLNTILKCSHSNGVYPILAVLNGLVFCNSWYLKAQQIAPKNGRPYNQLAVLAVYTVRQHSFN